MKKPLILIAAILFHVLPASLCPASYISLQIRPGFSYTGGNCHARIHIVNKGDEPAVDLRVLAELGDKSHDGGHLKELAADGEYTFKLDLGEPPAPAGIHTAMIRVNYTDSNGYPFTAIRPLQVITAMPDSLNDLINMDLASTRIRGSSEMVLSISSARQETTTATVRLSLPSELECSDNKRDFIIPAGKTVDLQFKIKNTFGQPGSKYAVYAVVDYSHQGQHMSKTKAAMVTVAGPWTIPSFSKLWWLLPVVFFFAAFVVIQLRSRSSQSTMKVPLIEIKDEPRIINIFPLAVMFVLLAFIFYHIRPHLLFLNTLTTGGDTPAHNYLASHFKEQFFGHGRMVSWGGGWWCGFPMFQYYFCLPYLLISFLDLFLPFNVAFKLVSVLGIVALPVSIYASARIMRLVKPIPLLLSIVSIVFLFDRSHTMWGLNINSTLAGMISASISLPFVLLFIACVSRDMDTGRFRLSTVFLLTAVVASHFFSSLLAGITVSILPFLKPRASTRKAMTVLVKESSLAFLFMSWWLIPLISKTAFSADFGINWLVPLAEVTKEFPFVSVLFLPPAAMLMIPFAVFAVVTGIIHGTKFVILMAWLFIVSTVLFLFGYNTVSRVFVNVRLWPFMHFSLLALGACGIGRLLAGRKAGALAICALLVAALAFGIKDPHHVRSWAQWNYSGLERKPGWPVVRELVLPLDGSPGRLANDLHPSNHAGFGSSRFFEAVPHIIRKPILEGGIVNSALGSMFSYYIQGETSDNCAGFPNIVIPTTFNITNATKHLKLCNVKHFIARSPRTRLSLTESADWQAGAKSGNWQLFELMSHDGRYVIVPEYHPMEVQTDFKSDAWKEDILAWIYDIGAVDQPFILSSRMDPPSLQADRQLSRAQYRQFLKSTGDNTGDIREWLLLGPFSYPENMTNPIEFSAIQEDSLDPLEGQKSAGRFWRLTPSRLPVDPSRFYLRKDGLTRLKNFVSYGFVSIFSPSNQEILIHYSCDDAMKIWVNDAPVVTSSNTGWGRFGKIESTLKEGRNRLLVKCQQYEGGHFFQVRITDTNGKPFSDITASVVQARPNLPEQVFSRTDTPDVQIVEHEVSDQRIRFRTSAIGLPHLIKCTYFPNWRVRGAEKVHLVTPGFMLVYPTQNEVELYYGRTISDNIGRGLTFLGVIMVIFIIWRRTRSTSPKTPFRTGSNNPLS